VTPERIAEGKQLYQTGSCIQCHAQNGDGGTRGPPLSDRQWLHSNGSFASIASIIREGVNLADMMDGSYRQPMPSRGGDRMNLTDAQVLSIAAYVYSLTNPPPAPGKAP
jgi:mono/diheme cytochrome c family protein